MAAVGYSEEFNVLLVRFIKSGDYIYYDVPEDVYEELLSADSKGSYYNECVKGQYEVEKIE